MSYINTSCKQHRMASLSLSSGVPCFPEYGACKTSRCVLMAAIPQRWSDLAVSRQASKLPKERLLLLVSIPHDSFSR